MADINRITTEAQKELYDRALAKWGKVDQQDMTVGEIGELLTLFGREAQGRATAHDWKEEIADVIIVLGQLALIKGVAHELDEMIDTKLEKLRKKID